ncbi:MAG: glycoside hydrolase family 5 protein [Phycisphaerae bacterium]|nr:glycoside hydrolase family 5 protein [Phycisphaerae bacterium]MDD5381656.1 glycoside hydrolase family 5 protein [Phycisphaerae bacterium]
MKPLSILILCVNLTFGTVSYAAEHVDSKQPVFDGSNAPPTLHTEKNRILDANGNDIILRGVWFADSNLWNNDKYDASVVKYIRRNWNANVIRLPIHPLKWRENPDYLSKYVDEIVRATGENGMYVVVGWHAHGNPLNNKTEAPTCDPNLPLAMEALKTIVTRYKKCRWVLYDSFNEPAYITWDEWKPVAEKLTDVINSVNPEAITLVSGVHWSHDLSGVLSNPVKRKNIIYEVHAYNDCKNPSCMNWKTTIDQLARRFPVIIGEWGYVEYEQLGQEDSSQSTNKNREYAVPLVDFAQKLGIGWIFFAYSAYWEPSLVVVDYNDLDKGDEVLTRAGYFVKEVLNNRPYHNTAPGWRNYVRQLSIAKNHFSEIDPNLFAYEKVKLNANIRSDNYNQLSIQLLKPSYDGNHLPVSSFEFKLGYRLRKSRFEIGMREGSGISDTTKWGKTDKWGKALTIRIENTPPKQQLQVAAMAQQDQLIFKGILGNIANIVEDVLASDNTLSEENKTFWRSKMPFFASKADSFIKNVEYTQPSD